MLTHNQEDIRQAKTSKYKLGCKNEVILLMVRIEWFKKTKIQNCNENRNKGYFLEVDIEYPKDLQGQQKDLQFLPKGIKISIFQKLISNLYDKKYVMYIRAPLKQALYHQLKLN